MDRIAADRDIDDYQQDENTGISITSHSAVLSRRKTADWCRAFWFRSALRGGIRAGSRKTVATGAVDLSNCIGNLNPDGTMMTAIIDPLPGCSAITFNVSGMGNKEYLPDPWRSLRYLRQESCGTSEFRHHVQQ